MGVVVEVDDVTSIGVVIVIVINNAVVNIIHTDDVVVVEYDIVGGVVPIVGMFPDFQNVVVMLLLPTAKMVVDGETVGVDYSTASTIAGSMASRVMILVWILVLKP